MADCCVETYKIRLFVYTRCRVAPGRCSCVIYTWQGSMGNLHFKQKFYVVCEHVKAINHNQKIWVFHIYSLQYMLLAASCERKGTHVSSCLEEKVCQGNKKSYLPLLPAFYCAFVLFLSFLSWWSVNDVSFMLRALAFAKFLSQTQIPILSLSLSLSLSSICLVSFST